MTSISQTTSEQIKIHTDILVLIKITTLICASSQSVKKRIPKAVSHYRIAANNLNCRKNDGGP